ncbi:Isopenicillin N synthase [Macrophomina phaseolina MS6]|uniref:Isopenicillin N synthase n=1 Tax=Macrophomina phaseolina (strain MS6) TaxID=1126212 RepID=K2RYW4_MACPH|nr:Isopenicillin N synthase [Macrophomina phaseolina MS6]
MEASAESGAQACSVLIHHVAAACCEANYRLQFIVTGHQPQFQNASHTPPELVSDGGTSTAPPPFTIPTVDIAPYLSDPSSPAAQRVVEQINQACRSTGFFQIINHGVPAALQDEVFRAAQRFFRLPLEEKKKLDAKTTIGHRGYDVLESQSYEEGVLPDLKEGFYVGNDVPATDPRAQAGRFFMGPNVWPASLEAHELQQPAEAYFAAVYALSLRVLDMIAASLPYDVRATFARFTQPAELVAAPLRLLHYPPARPRGQQRQLGASAHTDFGAVTLLMQDGNPGLQVLDRHGAARWVDVPSTRRAYVVNVGDMLERWTRGYYRSSVHRVVNPLPRDRYSVVFFFDGNLDCPLVPLGPPDEGGAEAAADSGNAEEREDVLTVEKHMIERMTASYGKGGKK